MEEEAAAMGSSILYEAVQPLEASPQQSGAASYFVFQNPEEDACTHDTNSVVFRRIIDDYNGPSSVFVENEEADYLSLKMDGDDEQVVTRGAFFNEGEASIPTLLDSSRVLENPPWHPKGLNGPRSVRSPLLELHQEIVNFCELVSPTPEEDNLRTIAVQRVAKVIKSIWKQSHVKVFGSFATGLYLPTSDIDVVILDSGCGDTQSGLKALAKALAKEGIAKNLQVIAKARVPIVKFIEIKSLISFDISFDLESGPHAAKFIKDSINAIPPLKPLCLVLKIFLQQRELNEVYTGGIGSYALLVMLLTYLQTHPSRLRCAGSSEANTLECNLGVLLVDFLELYGRSLNVKDVGISCRNGGRFFKKKSKGFLDSKRPYLLSVEDPQTPTSDIGKNSFNFQKVRFAFVLAHRLLTNVDSDEPQTQAGFLARIVRVDEKLAGRKPMMRLLQLHHAGDSWGSDDEQRSHLQERQKHWQPPQEDHEFPRGGESEHYIKRSKKRKRANRILDGEEDNFQEDRVHKRSEKQKGKKPVLKGKGKKVKFSCDGKMEKVRKKSRSDFRSSTSEVDPSWSGFKSRPDNDVATRLKTKPFSSFRRR